jgi:PPP family 3-phenylpropionic acid transporter
MIGVGLAVLMFFSTFLVPERPKNVSKPESGEESGADFPINWVQVGVLLLVVLFWQFGMAPYNTFFDLYMREQGSSATLNGFLISFGSLCEIGVFIFIAVLFNRFSEKTLIAVALLLTVVRWSILYMFADNFWMVLFSQSLHAATFGVVHSVAVHRIGHLFPDSKASFGQGLYVALGTGLGLFVGNLLAGMFWDGTGIIYLHAAGWTTLALVLALVGFREDGKEGQSEY